MVILQGALLNFFELILGTDIAISIVATNKNAEANQEEAKALKSRTKRKGNCHE